MSRQYAAATSNTYNNNMNSNQDQLLMMNIHSPPAKQNTTSSYPSASQYAISPNQTKTSKNHNNTYETSYNNRSTMPSGATTNPTEWPVSLFGCFADPSSCCESFFCGDCSRARQLGVFEPGMEDSALCLGVGGTVAESSGMPCGGCFDALIDGSINVRVREHITRKYGIIDGGDHCFVSCCCLPCATSQQHRTMALYGDDPGGICRSGSRTTPSNHQNKNTNQSNKYSNSSSSFKSPSPSRQSNNHQPQIMYSSAGQHLTDKSKHRASAGKMQSAMVSGIEL